MQKSKRERELLEKALNLFCTGKFSSRKEAMKEVLRLEKERKERREREERYKIFD